MCVKIRWLEALRQSSMGRQLACIAREKGDPLSPIDRGAQSFFPLSMGVGGFLGRFAFLVICSELGIPLRGKFSCPWPSRMALSPSRENLLEIGSGLVGMGKPRWVGQSCLLCPINQS